MMQRRAYLVNGLAAGWVAAAGWKEGLDLVHVSTDFVFDGTKTGVVYARATNPTPSTSTARRSWRAKMRSSPATRRR